MTDLYLIAHKVRGEPAFDIAAQVQIGEELGWIIPTSGHRAYPYGWQPLSALDLAPGFNIPMPANWRDHYATIAAPSAPAKLTTLNLAELGL